MSKSKLTLGLCEGRHSIPEVQDYIFSNNINPTNLSEMAETCHNRLKECNQLDLYVTGLTVALVSVINYCCINHIPLTLYHFDRETNSYYPQYVKTQVDCDLLIEGGYMVRNELDSKHM